MTNVKTEALPKYWDEHPKGCYSPHPESREICQLPTGDGHQVHKRKHPDGRSLECWTDPEGAEQNPVRRWALWSQVFGFYKPLPYQTEILFDSRRAAMASVHSGNYNYKPVRVKLVPEL